MSEERPSSGKGLILVVVLIAVILLPLAYSLLSSVLAQSAESPRVFLERPDPKYKECVEDTEYMRFHHWELLRRVREEVVRYGIRGDVGLHTCKDCHVNRERFCNQCHNSVSLFPDCYGCHYYP
jgi:hypothetical protein